MWSVVTTIVPGGMSGFMPPHAFVTTACRQPSALQHAHREAPPAASCSPRSSGRGPSSPRPGARPACPRCSSPAWLSTVETGKCGMSRVRDHDAVVSSASAKSPSPVPRMMPTSGAQRRARAHAPPAASSIRLQLTSPSLARHAPPLRAPRRCRRSHLRRVQPVDLDHLAARRRAPRHRHLPRASRRARSASSATTASFARPPSGGAVTATFSAPSAVPAREPRARRAPGCTRTASRAPSHPDREVVQRAHHEHAAGTRSPASR